MGSVLSGSAVPVSSSSSLHQSEESESEESEMPPSGSASDDWYDPAQVRKGGPSNVKVPDIDTLLTRDGYLRDHEREIREVDIVPKNSTLQEELHPVCSHPIIQNKPSYMRYAYRRRYGNFEDFLGRLDKVEGGICKFSESYKNMGCRVGADNTFVSTQWIPGAQARSKLMKRFNLKLIWRNSAGGVAVRRLQRLEQVRVPVREAAVRQVGDQAEAGRQGSVPSAASLQAEARNQDSERRSCGQVTWRIVNIATALFKYLRLDPWATYVKPPAREEDGYLYDHYFWNPPKDQVYKMTQPRPSRPSSLRVYECHVGIREFIRWIRIFRIVIQYFNFKLRYICSNRPCSLHVFSLNLVSLVFPASNPCKNTIPSVLLRARSTATGRSPTTCCRASRRSATTPFRSWPSWSTHTTPASDTRDAHIVEICQKPT